MKRLRFWGAALLAPALTVFLAGCGDKSKEAPKAASGETKKSGDATAKPVTTGGEKTPVEGKGVASLKGKVTYDGTPPAPKDLKPEMEKQQDKSHCVMGDTLDPTWTVGKDGGVANVVVFIRAPEGKFLSVPADQQKRSDTVEMDQPFCLFKPHVVAVQPSVYDPQAKKQVPTGQQFIIKNSAPINHNTAWKGRPLVNDGKNEILKAKDGKMVVEAKPGRPSEVGGEDLINISCDIHKWMNAKAAVFDHPYYAVTKEDGTFEIKGIPAGAEVEVVVWHESMGDSLKKGRSEKVTLKEGENTKDVKVK